MADLSWDEYFMKMAYLASERSSCIRRKVGAVAVNGNRILATGYNGVPSGFAHCDKVGCLRQMLDIPSGHRHEFCRGLHAEQNVLIQAAIHGINLKGSTLYCTLNGTLSHSVKYAVPAVFTIAFYCACNGAGNSSGNGTADSSDNSAFGCSGKHCGCST